MAKFTVLNHPLIQHKLTIIRNKDTGTKVFREVANEIAELMVYEITRDLAMEDVEVETPMGPAIEKQLSGKKLAVVPILRAGLGMVDGVLELIPAAKVGHIGMYRDEKKHYNPTNTLLNYQQISINDNYSSLIQCLQLVAQQSWPSMPLKKRGATSMRLVVLVAAPEGVKAVQEAHPDVDIYAAGLDDHLNEDGYIVPGLGDAGDRLFGTK